MSDKTDKGYIPGAHPTAPGGMSRKALIAELVDKHDYEKGTKAEWDQVTWPHLIDLVAQERLAREAEVEQVNAENADLAAQVGATPREAEAEFRPEPDGADDTERIETEPDDFDDLLSEFGLDDEHDDDGNRTTPDWTEEQPIMEALDGVSVSVVEEVMSNVEDGVLDPETMFAEMSAARAEHEASQPAPLFIGIPGVRDYVFDGHAGAGPSGAERWMNCTMSLSASRKFLETLSPNQQATFAVAGTAARQGTTAHAAAEVEANHVLGRVDEAEVDMALLELSVNPGDDEAFDDEMAEYITEYIDLIRQYAQDRGDENILVESVVEADIPLVGVHEGEVYVIRGSADAIALPTKAEPTLVVGDLKYGNGIDVDVDENPQIRLYALGVLALLADPESGEIPDWVNDVVYHIIQPRLGGIKTWTESIDDLLAWRDETLAPALTKALYGAAEGATYEPSELACQWCPARGTCPALTESRVEAASELFDVIVEAEYNDGPGAFPEVTTMTSERLSELLTMALGLKDITSDLKEEAQRRLHRGEEVPGYWLVNYSPNRQWAEGATEEGGPLADIEEVWTEPTLMSPPQAEKALGKEGFKAIEHLVVKPDKRPVISTGAKDKRSKWEGRPPEAMFADESEGDTND